MTIQVHPRVLLRERLPVHRLPQLQPAHLLYIQGLQQPHLLQELQLPLQEELEVLPPQDLQVTAGQQPDHLPFLPDRLPPLPGVRTAVLLLHPQDLLPEVVTALPALPGRIQGAATALPALPDHPQEVAVAVVAAEAVHPDRAEDNVYINN